jgi:hypothetical protein
MFGIDEKLNTGFSKMDTLGKIAEAQAGWLSCIHAEAKLQRRMLERSHGSVAGLNEEKYPPRSLLDLPIVREGTVSEETKVNFIDPTNSYVPSDGCVSNIGEEAFMCQYVGDGGIGEPFTVLPGAVFSIRSLVKGAQIKPKIEGTTISYAFYLQ